jgi:hypothetical protein
LRALLAYLFFVHRQRRARHRSEWSITPQQVRMGYAFLVLSGLAAWAALWLAGSLALPGDQAALLTGLYCLLGLLFFPRPILRQVEFLTEGKGSRTARLRWRDRIAHLLVLPLRFGLRRRPPVGVRTPRR